jgi:hypothetical protein
MFCPKCATQNIEGASFCRACGANISLIPQALSGQLPAAPDDNIRRRLRRRRRYEEENPSFERGIINIFMGIGFVIAGIAVMLRFPAGFTWGWALFIPGFSCFGRGVAAMVAASQKQKQGLSAPTTQLNSFQAGSLPSGLSESNARDTGQMMPPAPSVTEGTTRHLGSETPTQHFDSFENQKPS